MSANLSTPEMASGLGLGLGPESFALSLLGLCGRGRENENDEESLSKKKKKKNSLLECSLLLGSRRAIYRVHIRMRLALRFLHLLLVVRPFYSRSLVHTGFCRFRLAIQFCMKRL
jgi:hypothetical protein